MQKGHKHLQTLCEWELIASFMHWDVQIPLQELRDSLDKLLSLYLYERTLSSLVLVVLTDTFLPQSTLFKLLLGDEPSGSITFRPLGAREEKRDHQLARHSSANLLLCKYSIVRRFIMCMIGRFPFPWWKVRAVLIVTLRIKFFVCVDEMLFTEPCSCNVCESYQNEVFRRREVIIFIYPHTIMPY